MVDKGFKLKRKGKCCGFCGDKFYKKVEIPDLGWIIMCKGCYESYMSCENCNVINSTSEGRNMNHYLDVYHKDVFGN